MNENTAKYKDVDSMQCTACTPSQTLGAVIRYWNGFKIFFNREHWCCAS